jgi:hypothetical protein
MSLIFINDSDRADLRVLAAYPLCALIKDAILFAVYVNSFFSKTVRWHGKTIRIVAKSRIISSQLSGQ